MNNCKKVIGLFLFALVFVAALAIGNVNTQAAETAKVSVKVTYNQTDARKIAKLINEMRTGKDNWLYDTKGKKIKGGSLPKLKYDYNLEKLAMKRVAEIGLTFSHTRPNGQMYYYIFDEGDGTVYTSVGENIAVGQKDYQKAFAAWAEADKPYSGQAHRRQMLSAGYSSVGIAHGTVNGYKYWVTMFGNSTSVKQKTTALNDVAYTTVTVPKSKVNASNLKLSASEIRMDVENSIPVPTLTTSVKFGNTWMKKAIKVRVPATWTASDTTVAKIVDNKTIKPLVIGNVILKTTIGGKDFKVKIKVRSKATSITSLKGGKEMFTVKVKQITSDASGYEIQYATEAKFKKFKSVEIKGAENTTKDIKKLKDKTKYYVRVRTIKKKTRVDEKGKSVTEIFCSAWSPVKTVTTGATAKKK